MKHRPCAWFLHLHIMDKKSGGFVMGSNKLVFAVLMSLSLFSLTACKKGNDSSRTTIRKGTPDSKVKNAAELEKQTQLEKDKQNGTNPTPGGGRTRTDGTKDEPGKNQTTIDETCEDIQNAATKNGWKLHSLANKSDPNTKISYYILEKSVDKLTNPVVYFKSNAFEKLTTEDFKTFADRYETLKIDPILIDARGTGCSIPLPDLQKNAGDLNKYGSRYAVQDAEAVRKTLLQDKKWKILAHGTGGAVALRYVQLAPSGVESIHIADFAPMKNQANLMKIRIKQEQDSFSKLMKEHSLTEEDISKAQKNLGAEKELIDVLAADLSNKKKWDSIASTIKGLADGSKKADGLEETLAELKKQSDLNTAARILDLDSSKNLSACSEAVQSGAKNILNSCRLEKLVGHGIYSNIKNLVNHDALNMDIIKANITKNNITYHLFSGKQSTLYPTSAYEEHEKAMGEILDEQQSLDLGSEIVSNEDYLETLK